MGNPIMKPITGMFTAEQIAINGGVIQFASAVMKDDATSKKVTTEGNAILLDGSTITFSGVSGPAGAVASPVDISLDAGTIQNVSVEGSTPLAVGDKNNAPVNADFVSGPNTTTIPLTAVFIGGGSTKVSMS